MKKPTAEVLAELTGDDRTEAEAATHFAIVAMPCACHAPEDHNQGREEYYR